MKENVLRRLVREELIKEVQVGSTLYHRSKADLEVGDVLNADKVPNDSHERKAEAEREFEEFRKARHPDKPSRLRSVFLSPTPKSRFNMKGQLYEVEVRGNFHVADSRMFDIFIEPYEWGDEWTQGRALKCYWNPQHSSCPSLSSVNPKYIEVLAEKAVVTNTPEDNTLRKGDKVRIMDSPWRALQSEHDPEVWKQHPKIAAVTSDDKVQGYAEYYAMPEKGSVWTVDYVKQTDSAMQQRRIDPDRGISGSKGNFSYTPWKRLILKDGPVELHYSSGMGKGEMGRGEDKYIEDLEIEKVS